MKKIKLYDYQQEMLENIQHVRSFEMSGRWGLKVGDKDSAAQQGIAYGKQHKDSGGEARHEMGVLKFQTKN